MKNVWLDLEETVIKSWSNCTLINLSRIRKWLDEYDVWKINIYSFAIYNQKDKDEFGGWMKRRIEEALHCEIVLFPSVEEIQNDVYQYEHIEYDSMFEFMQLNGKHWSFIKYCLGNYPYKDSYLIDDTVPSLEIKINGGNGNIRLINIVDI